MKHLCALVTLSSFTLLAFGLWIPAKALVAQELLALAWAESQARQQPVRPWPWADTWPVARLALPRGEDNPQSWHSFIVLDGAHGESLAFGPGQVFGGGSQLGPTVIAGHRDTHFSPLKHIETGQEIRLQNRDGQWHSYRVNRTRVVDSRDEMINVKRLPEDALILITCFPFNGLQANGPLRYVVEARATSGNQVATVVDH